MSSVIPAQFFSLNGKIVYMEFNWNEFYNRVYDWIVQYGPGIVLAIVVFIAGIFAIRLINKWVKKGIQRKRINPSIRYFLQNLIAITLQIFLVVITLQIAGFKLTVFSAILAGLTVAAGLALSGTLQNFVSGILILFLKPYRVGDNVIAQGQEGTVTTIQLFFTTILTYDNKTMIVPNGQLSNSAIINLSQEGKRRLDVEFRLPYVADFKLVKEVVLKTVTASKDILQEPAARVGMSMLDADRYVVSVNLWTNAHGFYDTKIAINERIVEDLKQAGVKFPGM